MWFGKTRKQVHPDHWSTRIRKGNAGRKNQAEIWILVSLLFSKCLSHLSSGDLLREEVKNSTDLGLKAKDFMNKGQLVPDDLIFDIIEKTLSKPECSRVMFDGFPRTLKQAEKVL